MSETLRDVANLVDQSTAEAESPEYPVEPLVYELECDVVASEEVLLEGEQRTLTETWYAESEHDISATGLRFFATTLCGRVAYGDHDAPSCPVGATCTLEGTRAPLDCATGEATFGPGWLRVECGQRTRVYLGEELLTDRGMKYTTARIKVDSRF